MAILKIEINTDEIYSGDYEGDGAISFEDLVKSAITGEIKKEIFDKLSKDIITKESKKLRESTEKAIETKLENLINEDLAFTDEWNKPIFVGSIEDYIKKQIDEKLLKPVNSAGKPVSGCSISEHTWVEWSVKKKIESAITNITDMAVTKAHRYAKQYIDEMLEKFKVKTLNNIIMSKLKAIGVGESE